MSYTLSVDQAVARAYLLATGKDTPPIAGNGKYQKLVDLMNIYTQVWANESDTNWSSLRSTFTLAPVISNSAIYAMPATIGKISDTEGDFVRIYHINGINESDYSVVPIERLYDYGTTRNSYGRDTLVGTGTVAVTGQNLIFPRAFISTDPQFGGSIIVPGYSIPPTLAQPTDIIVVDDPNWLCFMVAAEYDRTDITRVGQYPNLIAQANEAMLGMKTRNETQIETVNVGDWSPLGQTWSN